MRILLADDHAIIRCAFKHLLAGAFHGAQFGEAENCPQTTAMALGHPWDLIILDISMPGGSGFDSLTQIRKSRAKIPVLVVSSHAQKHLAVRAFKSGATGFLTKTSACDELIQAVATVRNGGLFLSNLIAQQCAAMMNTSADFILHENLSYREFEILQNIVSGRTMPEIAEDLSLSINTIYTYRKRVLSKMKMRTNYDLMSYALSNQLI